MTILDRNAGLFNGSFSVTRSTGSFGTGTVLVLAVFGNTTVTTPAGWTLRASSVVDLGLYLFEKAGAGEASIAVTTAAGSGMWACWELGSGSAVVGTPAVTQTNGAATTFTTGSLTPTAGDRHLLAVVGGVGGSGNARNVTAFSDSFTERADLQATSFDYPFAATADRDVTANGSTAYTTTATYSAVTNTARGALFAAYSNPSAGDTTPPPVPTGLTVGAVGSTTADLTWAAAGDATGYEIEIVGP